MLYYFNLPSINKVSFTLLFAIMSHILIPGDLARGSK